MPGAGLAFLPPSTEDEEEAMKLSDEDPGIVLLHSAAGLVLCCRGRSLTTRYYVCNPVTCQFVALPKHPPRSPVTDCRCGLLTVADGTKSFQVTIMHWPEDDQTFLKLSIFSSDTGQWQMWKVSLPQALADDEILTPPPILGQSGTAYFMQDREDYTL
ncbi:hypothetical protein QOZ80_1BG0071590 [Eleusine coracana subsp. coracana]|nr:hypothetical protein QOZ80_1BG0071590 [Eleusine coracana subsp. coracana]